MSLPIVMIFERHWDETPRFLIKDLIPKLAREGYDTLCFEAPQDISSDEIISAHNSNLEFFLKLNSDAEQYLKRANVQTDRELSDISFFKLKELMRLYVSSQRFVEVAEKIKYIPAAIIFRDVLKKIDQLPISINGIDVNAKDFTNVISGNLHERSLNIGKYEVDRINTFTANLIKLYHQRSGIVFLGGATHANNLISELRKKGMGDNVVYYFPHSPKRYEESCDDLKLLTTKVLKKRSQCLSTRKEIKDLSTKIVREIKAKNTKYIAEVLEKTSHSEFLCDTFQTKIRLFRRPGYYVDALLDADQVDTDSITHKLRELHIQTRETFFNHHKYLVIPEVNTPEVGNKLRSIQKK